MMRKLFSLVLLSAVTAIAASTGYHIIKEIKIGGEGGWDYLTVDSAARRLYVSHASHVVVVDIDANKVVGDIPDTPGVHGIAIADDYDPRHPSPAIRTLNTLRTRHRKVLSVAN